MQLNKKLIPLVLVLSATPLVLNATSSDEVSFKQMKYVESDDRIEVDYTALDFKKDFGADYTLNISVSYDAISGGTPIWDSISGGSSVDTNDDTSSASPCVDEAGNYTCKDTRSSDILGDGHTDMSDYEYRNVEIEDTRVAVSANLTKRTAARDEMTFGLAYSKEEDFKSQEISTSYLYNIDQSRNSSLSFGISYQANSAYHYLDDQWKDFDIINTQIGYTHIFTKDTVGQINYFYIKQSGVLSNPYQTIIRKFDVSIDNTPYYKYYRAKEKRPDEKNSAGMTLDLVSKIHDKVSWHGDYRLYKDDWDVLSHTISTSLFYDLGSDWTFIPYVRYYKQSAASFHKEHDAEDFTFNESDYGTSDERLGAYHGLAYSIGLEKEFDDSLSFNIYFAHQKQSYGLTMDWVSLGVNYAF